MTETVYNRFLCVKFIIVITHFQIMLAHCMSVSYVVGHE
jgi:hypothetical protein